jgi:hypothetical protein
MSQLEEIIVIKRRFEKTGNEFKIKLQRNSCFLDLSQKITALCTE